MQKATEWNFQFTKLKNKEREMRNNLSAFSNFLHSPENKEQKEENTIKVKNFV